MHSQITFGRSGFFVFSCHIVKETVDSRGKRLSYNENEAVLTLDKKDGMIQSTASPDSYAWKLCEEARRLFEVFRANHNSQVVRTSVQGILKPNKGREGSAEDAVSRFI